MTWQKLCGVITLFLLGTMFSFATAQFPEELVFEGETHALFANPLEDYFSFKNPRPNWLEATSTACWRGYMGSWEIKDGKLYLTKLIRKVYEGERGDVKPVDYDISKKIFPNEMLPLMATWFSGVLRVPQGKELRYVHMGYGSIYEQDLYLMFDQGKLIGKRVVKNDPKNDISDSDLAWREIGKMNRSGAVAGDGVANKASVKQVDWLEGREFFEKAEELEKNGETFKIRGIYFPGKLWIPPTPNSQDFQIRFLKKEELKDPPSSSPVELTAVADKQIRRLMVSSIRELPPGEAIQKEQ
ncbi:MAG: hypothetical protein LBH01_03740 [Verrucomicrobiales bacterium]|jgi:hypothetical protein|nr:hypothetical protein [Verrucomicrobiales bacterium]